LLPSQIVDFNHPEERMAARLISRLSVTPPIDIEDICRSFADLAFKDFPVNIDGLCLDIKVPGKRPKVWVARSAPPVRRRFTLAHEVGHIIIPWHRGTIVDDVESPRSGEKSRYHEMEAEANRFAAELLMPSVWTAALSERTDHAAGLMHSIREIANVSFPAAFLKAARFGRPGFVGAEVRDGVIVRSVRTPRTDSKAPLAGSLVESVDMPAAYPPQIISGADASYYWWQIQEHVSDPGGETQNWRATLEMMLQEIPTEFRAKTRQSVNAIIGLAIGREPKGGDVNRIYRRGLEAAQNRHSENQWVRYILTHSQFNDYVLARARDRALQN
jgi:hypothetical protein